MTRRLVLPEGALREGRFALPEALAHYVKDVLRMRPGDPVMLSDGAGVEACATLDTATKAGVFLTVGDLSRRADAGPSLTLLQAVVKGEKMDAIVRQCTELGVRTIVPVLTARAVAEKHGRIERWRSIAEDAIRVSGRAFRPKIELVVSLPEVLSRPRAPLAVCLDPRGASPLPGGAWRSAELLIGPEGGLEPDEVELVRSRGFTTATLGPHTLRADTAAPAACALMLLR